MVVTLTKRGDIVEVTFELSFLAPINPANVWFDNVGDNLDGSTGVNGPLNYYATGTFTNVSPTNCTYHSVGASATSRGCLRFWTGGSTYPSSTSPPSNAWTPITPLQTCSVKVTMQYQVHSSAVIGTVFQVPTRQTPCNDSDRTIKKMMINIGTGGMFSIAKVKVHI